MSAKSIVTGLLAWLVFLGPCFPLAPPKPTSDEVAPGTLGGEVVDPPGAVLTGATVTLRNLGTSKILSTVTKSDGHYAFPNIEPGEYEISIEKSGFQKKVVRAGVRAGQRLWFSTMLEFDVRAEKKDCPLPSEPVNLRNRVNYGQLLIRLERHPCLGCQLEYSLEIRGDGTVRYTSDWPEKKREASGSISRSQLRRLILEFQKVGYFSLCGKYEHWIDQSETVTSIALDGLQKQVVNSGRRGPPALEDLESEIERTVNSHRWVHRDGDSLRDPIIVEEDVMMASKPGFTALMEAAGRRDWKRVRQLAAAGANVNARDETGWTSLMMAAAAHCNRCVRLLLEHGTRVNARDDNGDTSLVAAGPAPDEEEGHPGAETIRLLIRAGADVNATNRFGETALMWAAWRVQPERVKALIEAGADVNARDEKGRTALSELKEGDTDRFLRTVAILRTAGAER